MHNPYLRYVLRAKKNQSRLRGSQLAEFSAALLLFVLFVIVPIVDFMIVPVRAVMVQQIMTKQARRLAFAESFGKAIEMLDADSEFFESLLMLGGLRIDGRKLYLQVGNASDKKDALMVSSPGSVPERLLPSNPESASSYKLVLEMDLLFSPAFLLNGSGMKIPGISAPFPLTMRACHAWENLGKNPESGKFYLNE